jgi:hypothetical protein
MQYARADEIPQRAQVILKLRRTLGGAGAVAITR